MTRHAIIRAAQLTPGLDTIIVALPGRTIRSRAAMVQHDPHGIVRVAFESGDILSLNERSTVGCIKHTRAEPTRHAR